MEQQDRELLIRIDERTQLIPGLILRVRALEDFKMKAVAWGCGAGCIVAFVVDMFRELVLHK